MENESDFSIELLGFLCSTFRGKGRCKILGALMQGLLKVWTEHSHWFLLNWKLFEISQQKFQHFYNWGRNEFSPNLKGVAQKLGPPRPFEVLDAFGGKSKSKAPNTFKFDTKWVPIEVDNWWKFGVDISNLLWEIWNWRFCPFNSSLTRYKNSFWKLFLYLVRDELKRQNLQFQISQKWLEISTPNFYQLST